LVTSTFLDLALLFGSVAVTSALLAQPCPILLAPHTMAIYAAVHALSVLSGIGSMLVSLSGVTGIGLVCVSLRVRHASSNLLIFLTVSLSLSQH
jgi:hypothetical protein